MRHRFLGGKGLSAATKVSQYERSFSSGDFVVERGKAMAGAQWLFPA
jgi:hypothetical protein